jgi:hypothetical protein
MMIRLILAIVGGLAAWRYRNHIKEYVNNQLPEVQRKATQVFGEAADKFNSARRPARPSIPERREGQA